jgi:drug/metabolite transporter (DMT)-like permease
MLFFYSSVASSQTLSLHYSEVYVVVIITYAQVFVTAPLARLALRSKFSKRILINSFRSFQGDATVQKHQGLNEDPRLRVSAWRTGGVGATSFAPSTIVKSPPESMS